MIILIPWPTINMLAPLLDPLLIPRPRLAILLIPHGRNVKAILPLRPEQVVVAVVGCRSGFEHAPVLLLYAVHRQLEFFVLRSVQLLDFLFF
jgi:hypothetical protein